MGYRSRNGEDKLHADFMFCECEPVTATQPSVPKATNCATAVAAAEIMCCSLPKDQQSACSTKIDGCGLKANLDAICQGAIPVDGSTTYQVCGQSDKGDKIVKGLRMEDFAKCLVDSMPLKDADLKY